MAGESSFARWQLWPAWRRGPDLVRHVADVVQDCTAPAGVDHCTASGEAVRVEVEVREDVESFRSGEAFLTGVTGQALAQFRTLRIEGGAARVTFVKRPSELHVGWICPMRVTVRYGVVLEVATSEPDGIAGVDRTFERVVAAIDRGRPRVGRRPRWGSDGSSATGVAPTVSPESKLLESISGWPRPGPLPPVFIGAALALYALLLLDAAKPLRTAIAGALSLPLIPGQVPLSIASIGAAVVALAAWLAQRHLVPAVEIARMTRLRRAIKGLTAGISVPTVAAALAKLAGALG